MMSESPGAVASLIVPHLFLAVSFFGALCVDELAIFRSLGLPSWGKRWPGNAALPPSSPGLVAAFWFGSGVAYIALVAYSAGLCHTDYGIICISVAFLSISLLTMMFAMFTHKLRLVILGYIVCLNLLTVRMELSLLPVIACFDAFVLSLPISRSALFASIGCSRIATESKDGCRERVPPTTAAATTTVASATTATTAGSSRAPTSDIVRPPEWDGACFYSTSKGVTVAVAFALAVALESTSSANAPTHRILQPLWDGILYVGMPYITNSLFAVTVATATYVVACAYFSYLDLSRSATKIQKDWWPSPADMWAAAWPQLLFYAWGQVMIWVLWRLYPDEYTAHLPKLAPSCFSLVRDLTFVALAGDFLIYWEHRIMHCIPYLRNHVHSVHHTYTAVFSWAGGWVHPAEDLVVVACQALPVLAIGPHPLTQWLFACFWVVCLIDEHSGHDVWWSPYQLLPFTGWPQGGGAAPHDIHHYKPTKNFGFVFIIWDRMFGTFQAVDEPRNVFVPPFCKQCRQ